MLSNPNRIGDELQNELRNRKVFLDEDKRAESLSLRQRINEKHQDDRMVDLMVVEDNFDHDFFLYEEDNDFFCWGDAASV